VNVGLLGIKSEKHDEGTKNFGINLADALQTSVDEVLYINIQAGIGLTELKQLRNHDLDLVHLIPGPTFKGLFLLEMVGRYTGARTVATALQPRFSRVSKQVARLFPADLLLVHSSGQLDTMVNVGRELSMVPCGGSIQIVSYPSIQRRRDSLEQNTTFRSTILCSFTLATSKKVEICGV